MARAILVSFVLFSLCLAAPKQGLAQGACTRADLQSAVDRYLAAQREGNPATLSLAASAKYIENTQASSLDKGILKSALKIDFSRSLLDTQICETFTEVIVTDKSHPYVLGVRLKINGRNIAEIGAVVGLIRWPTGVPDSHLFRVEQGKLRFVHSLTVCTVPNCGFAQRPPAAGR